MCETLLLSLAGGAAGLGFAAAAMPLLVGFVSQQFNLGGEIPLDNAVLLFTIVVSIITGLLAGAWPAWRGSKADLNDALKQGGRTGSDSGTKRTRSVLVAAEGRAVADSSGRSRFDDPQPVDSDGVNPGFDAAKVLTLTIPVPVPDAAEGRRFLRSGAGAGSRGSRRRVRGIDWRASAARRQQSAVQPSKASPRFHSRNRPNVPVRSISPGYLRAMRIPCCAAARLPKPTAPDAPHAVLISDAMARRFWPDEDPIGKHLRLSFSPEEPREVVGIVAM